MPKIEKPPKAKAPAAKVPAAPSQLTLEEKGTALTLAWAAEEFGLDIAGLMESPERLKQALGTEVKPSRMLQTLAHKLHRDAVDAMLWRANGAGAPRPVQVPEAKQPAPTALRTGPGPSNGKSPTPAPSEPVQAKPGSLPGKPKTQAPSGPKPEGEGRTTLWGFAWTAVMRALGRENMSLDGARKALAAKGYSGADSTLKIQLKAGANNERGDPAPLTDTQMAELVALSK